METLFSVMKAVIAGFFEYVASQVRLILKATESWLKSWKAILYLLAFAVFVSVRIFDPGGLASGIIIALALVAVLIPLLTTLLDKENKYEWLRMENYLYVFYPMLSLIIIEFAVSCRFEHHTMQLILALIGGWCYTVPFWSHREFERRFGVFPVEEKVSTDLTESSSDSSSRVNDSEGESSDSGSSNLE